MKALLNKVFSALVKVWNWLKSIKFIYYILGFIGCEIFYPQYSGLFGKIVLVGMAFLLMRDIDKEFIPEVNFIDKLDNPEIGRNYAIVIASIICGICYIIGN